MILMLWVTVTLAVVVAGSMFAGWWLARLDMAERFDAALCAARSLWEAERLENRAIARIHAADKHTPFYDWQRDGAA